jgi:DnaJ like chaperone protein
MLQGWYGKILGSLLGFIIGRGLLGAIVGFVLGHQFDLAMRRSRVRSQSQAPAGEGRGDPEALRRAFFEATFQVMGHIAKSDGRVSEQEIGAARAAMQRFSLGEADRRRAIELYTQGKQPDFPLEGTLERLRWLAGGRPDLCRLFVQIQLEAALDGDGLGERPRQVLLRTCGALGIAPLELAALEAMLRMHRGARPGQGPGGARSGPPPRGGAKLADAYQVLGVSPTAADAEVTRAFRRLISQNHPDKMVAQGLPESMIAAAHERTQQILDAYETIKEHRGIK